MHITLLLQPSLVLPPELHELGIAHLGPCSTDPSTHLLPPLNHSTASECLAPFMVIYCDLYCESKQM
jgi:hypothetical protein